jgi:hypothetical protein
LSTLFYYGYIVRELAERRHCEANARRSLPCPSPWSCLRPEIGFRMPLATTVGQISATNGAQVQVSTRNLLEEDPAGSAGSGLGSYGSPVPPAVGADPGDAGLVGAGLVGAGLVGAGPVDASYFRPAPPGGPTLVGQQGQGQAHPWDQARSWEQAHPWQRARSWGQARLQEPTKNPS